MLENKFESVKNNNEETQNEISTSQEKKLPRYMMPK